MNPSPPAQTRAQRMAALSTANSIRCARADFKRRLRSGEASLADAIRTPPDYLLSARVYDLIRAVPGYGHAKALRVHRVARVSTAKTVGGLSHRQRDALADHFSPRGT